MSVKKAALQVLQEAGQPLTAREITRRVQERGLWKTNGKTPEATVAAQLHTDINARKNDSPFVHVGPNTFGLRDAAVDPTPVTKPLSKPVAKYSFTDAAEKVLDELWRQEADALSEHHTEGT